jgi:hypothetical protein
MGTNRSASEAFVRASICRDRGPRGVGVVAGMLGLLLARPCHATVVVSGNQEFQDQVAAAIVKIENAGPAERALIEDLSSSKNTITISKIVTVDDYTLCADFRLARNKTGIGSHVYWNPTSTVVLSFCTADPTAELLHELVHASLDDKGISNPAPVKGPDGPIAGDEVTATTFENRYRTTDCQCLRAGYGGRRFPIPPSPTPACSTPKPSTTPTPTATPPPTTLPCAAPIDGCFARCATQGCVGGCANPACSGVPNALVHDPGICVEDNSEVSITCTADSDCPAFASVCVAFTLPPVQGGGTIRACFVPCR